ncbi:MAG: DNA polymerase III subunit alpha [Actinobacteria bacterium]|nr:MAG: DNA polymerase III subunit alpha [Actinomycetota bacterium]
MSFTHLHVHGNFSFRDGASSVEELAERAKALGMDSLALTDHDGLPGAIRFYKACKKAGIKPIVGLELVVNKEGPPPSRSSDIAERRGGHHLTLLSKDLEGYRNLCRIVTGMHLRHGRPESQEERDWPVCPPDLLAAHASHLFALSGCAKGLVSSLLASNRSGAALEAAKEIASLFEPNSFFIELQNPREEGSAETVRGLARLGAAAGLPLVATNNVHYAAPDGYRVHELLASIRDIEPLPDASRRSNAELYLKSPPEMAALFATYPAAIKNTGWIARRCNADLDLESFKFPRVALPEGETDFSYLSKLCMDRVRKRYRPVTSKVMRRLSHELDVIDRMGFAAYFIIVYDIVRFARTRGIRCGGRGSAADSLVCYLLDVTHVDPIEHDLLFERFLNPERRDMPDIDIDFDAARRDEVIDYVYETYGHDKVAMVATVNTFRARSAVRGVAKAFDYEPEEVDRIAAPIPWTGASKIREALDSLPEVAGYEDAIAPYASKSIPRRDPDLLFDLCAEIDRYPRHLGVHLAGLVISPTPLTDYMPLQWSAKGVVISQFDKDDLEDMGLVKMDILGLRMLSAIEDAQEMVRQRRRLSCDSEGGSAFDIDALPLGDEKTYAQLRTTHTIGTFQLESPGMRELLGRLQPTRFADIVANISLFRPGPMQADMITPYIARRHGEQPVVFDHPACRKPLEETFGVIIYQEQILEIAAALAGFSLGQADQLRRAMTHDRSPEEMAKIRDGFIEGCLAKGVAREVAEAVFDKIKAFAAFGFNKAHASSFGLVAYQTAYLRAHHPSELLVGILNNMPMGFYPASVILNEIVRAGGKVTPLDINASRLRFHIEESGEARVAFSYVKGLTEREMKSIVTARAEAPFVSLEDFRARTKVSERSVERLLSAGAFDSFGSRKAQLASLAHGLPLDVLPGEDFSETEKLFMEYGVLGLYQRAHPMSFIEEELGRQGVVWSKDLPNLPDSSRVKVAGLLINRQTPPTKSGQRIIFSTIEDAYGVVDLTLFERDQSPENARANCFSYAILVEGQLRKTGAVGIGVIAKRVRKLELFAGAHKVPGVHEFKTRKTYG